MSDIPISARNLSKTYRVGFLMNRTVRALQGLDLEVIPGQIYGLLGPNGAGKSTTIKILMNLVRPTEGEATLFGRPPSEAHARRQVGFLPENPAPYEYLTGREFVTLAARLAGLSGHELDQRVTQVLGEVEMGTAEKLQIRRYSKGMVQRVALAQALVARPRLLILDEPTSGLDPIGRRQMRELIQAERARGTTVLFCTHIIPDVEALCDRLAVLVGGRRVREGRVAELLAGHGERTRVTLGGIGRAELEKWGLPFEDAAEADGTVQVTLPSAAAQQLIAEAVRRSARIMRVEPVRYSLEELFMEAVKETGRPTAVGGEIRA